MTTTEELEREAEAVAERLRASGFSIYDTIEPESGFYYSASTLQARLRASLLGREFTGPIRTRSVLAKRAVAEAMGYPVPTSFKRVRPRFLGQNLDASVQRADNFQVWNEEVDATRRYAFLRPDDAGLIVAVRVVTGEVIAALDTTGVLTGKYQAKRKAGQTGSLLVVSADTDALGPWLGPSDLRGNEGSTADLPRRGEVLPIAEVFKRMMTMLGTEIPDPGAEQDRVRGERLQELASAALAIGTYGNYGQWPDLRSQVLEVKLQMSPTIDLGLVLPSSEEPAELLGSDGLCHRDVRYAVVYGTPTGHGTILVDGVVVSTGEAFFSEFRLFGGLEINKKLQIRLPRGFFEAE